MSTGSRLLARAVSTGARFLPDKAPDPLRRAHKHLGKPLDRVDGRAKVTGQARFSAEFRPRDLTHAAVVTSTIARGRIRSIETAAAQQAAGVLAVITHENTPTMKPPPAVPPFSSGEQVKGTAASDLPVFGDAMIHWNGQSVAVVVASAKKHPIALVFLNWDGSELSYRLGERDELDAGRPQRGHHPPRLLVGGLD